jgi:hypothetical protein
VRAERRKVKGERVGMRLVNSLCRWLQPTDFKLQQTFWALAP